MLIVDVQNDFISGSLALKHCPAGEDGEEVVSVIEDLLSKNMFSVVGYTFDWHPPDHCSFIDNVSLYPLHSISPVTSEKAKLFDVVVYDKTPLIDQILWPRHCEIDSWGAELHKGIKVQLPLNTVSLTTDDIIFLVNLPFRSSNLHLIFLEPSVSQNSRFLKPIFISLG